MATRKTIGYYRTEMANGVNPTILAEVVEKYGNSNKKIRVDTEMGWNFRIEGFGVTNNKLYVYVYWQGDDTDGTDVVPFNELWDRVKNGGTYTIRAKTYYDGYRTRYKHSDIDLTKNDVLDAIECVKTYISPKEMKERKERIAKAEREKKMKEELLGKAKSFIGATREFVVHGWHNKNGYEYACAIVNRVIENNLETFDKMTDEEFNNAVTRLFNRNKYYSFRGAMYGECEPCYSWN